MSPAVMLEDSITLQCNGDGYQVTSYTWTIGSGSFPNKVTGINNSTLVIPNVRSSDANNYTCVVSNEGGNSNKTVQLTVTGMMIM